MAPVCEPHGESEVHTRAAAIRFAIPCVSSTSACGWNGESEVHALGCAIIAAVVRFTNFTARMHRCGESMVNQACTPTLSLQQCASPFDARVAAREFVRCGDAARLSYASLCVSFTIGSRERVVRKNSQLTKN
jgi:hypothetical protein